MEWIIFMLVVVIGCVWKILFSPGIEVKTYGSSITYKGIRYRRISEDRYEFMTRILRGDHYEWINTDLILRKDQLPPAVRQNIERR